MNKLEILAGAPNEIVMQRDFAAPRHLVKRAMTEPELVMRWQGNSRSALISVAIASPALPGEAAPPNGGAESIAARPGSTYRYVYRTPDGHEFSFAGVYREVSDERTVHTERFNDMPSEALVTITLTEKAGVTTMRLVMAFESAEIRDMVVKTGMADGAAESYNNLETLVSGL